MKLNLDMLNFLSKDTLASQVVRLTHDYTIENDEEIEKERKENIENYRNGKITAKEFSKRQNLLKDKIIITPLVVFSSTDILPF